MIFLLLLLVALVLIIVVATGRLWLLYRSWRNWRHLASLIPSFHGAFPLVGHAYKLIGNKDRFWKLMQEATVAATRTGGVLALWMGPMLNVLVSDPEDAATVMNQCLAKHPLYQKMAGSWVGEGLITAKLSLWKRNRRLLNPSFSPHVVRGFLPVFNAQAARLVARLQPRAAAGAPIDMRQDIAEVTLETLCQTVMGISLQEKSIVVKGYQGAVDSMFAGLARRLTSAWMHFDFIYRYTSAKKEDNEAATIVKNMSMAVLQKRQFERNQAAAANTTAPRFTPFLDLLLDLSAEGVFSESEVRQELDVMIAAGYDTTSRSLLSVLILVGTHPSVQNKLYDEIISVVGRSDLCTADVPRLVYTEAVIQEALRLCPVTALIARQVTEDTKLKKYTLPAGCGCLVSLWGLQRPMQWGTDAERFRPERWLERGRASSDLTAAAAYCVFSFGRRNCLGKSYAMLVLQTLLVHIVRRYRIQADFTKLRFKFELLLTHSEGYYLTLQPRQLSEI